MPAKQGKTGRKRLFILIVEDEASVLKLGKRILLELGYTVLAAATPGQAMETTKTHEGDIHLIITDVVMPEMNGRDLSRQIQNLYPDIKVLFMSGYTADVIAHQGVLDGGCILSRNRFPTKTWLPKSERSWTRRIKDIQRN